ncbi:hypothetical protein M9Y10_015499 [Tritrichomonas musculus]|uniref:MatE family protein n=1 Tax=Tritrichomonas musculus TaxID=1915356 RepID=A0ABR2L3C4_9EUKA
MDNNLKNELLAKPSEENKAKSNENSTHLSDSFSPTSQRQLTEEDIRLGGKPPLKTICILSSGPLLSQIASALYGVINTIWISKSLGDSGLTAISTYQNFETIGRSFAFFFQTSTSTKIASLFGEGMNSEASQVLTDLLRFSFICSIISPVIFIPISKVCVRWFGADDYITELGFKYIVPNLCLSIVSCFFYTCCGCLQAEGRSWLFSSVQIVALCLDMLVFCPLFLLGLKTGIAGAALANGVSELIPCLVILILYYRCKFGIKPQFKQLVSKFSSHSLEALKLGFPQLIFQLSNSVPGIIVRKFFGLSCGDDQNEFNYVMAAFNTFNRLWIIEGAVPNAINLGFIPAAAYAYGARRYIRIIWLFFHALWISFIWCSLTMICALAIPIPIAKIFSKTPEYLDWSKIILRKGNILTCICEVPGIITSLLQAMKKGTQASILSFFVQLFPVPVASIVLYYTNKHNIGRLVYCYPFQALFGVLFAIPFLIVALREIIINHIKKRTSSLYEDEELENISLSRNKGTKNIDSGGSLSSLFSNLISLSD